MARTKAAKGGDAALSPQTSADVRADRFELVALTVLLSLIPIRTFVSESHDFGTAAWFRNISPQITANPGHTYLFIAAIVFCAALVATARRIRGIGWQSTGLLAGGVLLGIAAAISTWRAGQKHLAIIGSLDFLGLLLYAATLRQLVSRAWQQRLAMSVILACGAAVVLKCGIQKWIELPATVQLFNEQYRAAMAYGQEDPGRLYDFEQRLKSGAVTAYFTHSNVLAGYLILIVMAGIGVAAARLKRAPSEPQAPSAPERVFKTAALAPAIIAILALVMLVFTQSKGGTAAAVGAIALWGVGRVVRSVPALSRKLSPMRAAIAVWMGLIALGAAVVALLSRNPEALGRSILFRWLYWQGAFDMLRGEGWWGVGANNFGRFFTRYKPVICPEDVQDPHSWIVRALTEWGALGLVALLAAWMGWTVATARQWGASTPEDAKSERFRGIGAWALVLSLLTGVAWSIVSWSGAPGLWEQTVLIAVACWLASFLIVSMESRQDRQYSMVACPVDAWALIAGLVAFLIHASIDLELFWAGPATLFMAMAAVAQASSSKFAAKRVGMTDARAGGQSFSQLENQRTAVLAMIGCAVSFPIAVLLGGTALMTGSRLDLARTSSRPQTWREYALTESSRLYETAIERNKLDATAIDELSTELIARVETPAHCDTVLSLLGSWRIRDPQNSAIDQRQSAVLARRFTLAGSPQDLDSAIVHMLAAVAANPSAPQRRLALGQLYELKSQRDPSARKDAMAAYQKALDLDEQRILVSKPNRMTPEMRSQLHERIEGLAQ